MTYKAPSPGRFDSRLNTTNYDHPQETNLLNIHRAMAYNSLGEPVLRTTSGAAPTANDAFGRLRVSNPFTLFDSFHRYQDNSKISEYTSGTASSTHSITEGCITMSVGNTSGDKIYRESTKVFPYQPGKGLSIMQTFCFDGAKEGLRQRLGFFDANNGIFLERNGDTVSFNIRTTTYAGTPEIRETVNQADWNVDPLDGTGTSTKVLNLSTTLIMFMDIEWLGVGSVRVGFVIDGEFVPVHIFHHSNRAGNTSPYMATANLPVRAEMENLSGTSGSSTFKLICSTVLSEGGFEPVGRPRNVGTPLASPRSISSGDGYVPVLTIRLKSTRLGAVVLPKAFSFAVSGNNNYEWRIVVGGTTAGGAGTWTSMAANSSVEYALDRTTITGGTIVDAGYIINSNQSSVSPSNLELLKFQLERNTFTGVASELTLCLACTGTNNSVWAGISVQETT